MIDSELNGQQWPREVAMYCGVERPQLRISCWKLLLAVLLGRAARAWVRASLGLALVGLVVAL